MMNDLAEAMREAAEILHEIGGYSALVDDLRYGAAELEGDAEAKANIQFVPTAETVRDAERYRWLRGHSFLIKDAIHFGSGARQHKPELLDAAIDKARGQE